ncbi:MAG: LutB/LldF family L-lactate oxidation iron-sulfur protein [Thermodesulfobacteriota bacterium]
MNQHKGSLDFRGNTAQAVQDAALRAALAHFTKVFAGLRTNGFKGIPAEEWREKASQVRIKVLDNLHEYLDQFSKAASKAGAVVHRAVDAQSARDTVAEILNAHKAENVVKSKSMVTEEIHLNAHLEEKGLRVIETDLGEYIVQIAGEKPSHIIAPAAHKSRQQVGRLFAEKLGMDYSDDPEVLVKAARKVLREEFLLADAGISGANMAVASTGSLVIFTNEGNGRMCTTVPPLHIAVLSIEKMVPTLADLPIFMRLLPRSASGQTLSSYLSMITGSRKSGENTGAQELHIVLVDNGRTEILRGEFRDILKCIRCSACLNVCPVYRIVGGHAYEFTYPGPMGIVLTTLLNGMKTAHPLLDGTTLCGACADVCPVKVPLPGLLAGLRRKRVEEGLTSTVERCAMTAYGLAATSETLFNAGRHVCRVAWPLLVRAGKDLGLERLPTPAKTSFRRSIR